MAVLSFFKENLWGVILLSVVCGVIGNYLSKLIESMRKKINNRLTEKKRINHMIKSGAMYSRGYMAGYARHKSSMHQIVLIGDYLMDLIIVVGTILFIIILGVGLLVILNDYWIAFPIIIFIISMFISFEYRRLKECRDLYDLLVRQVFGNEYFSMEEQRIKEFWDKTFSQEKDKEENGESKE